MLNFILLGLLVVSLLAISGCVDKTAEQAVEPAENVQTYVIGTEPYFPRSNMPMRIAAVL